MKKIMIALLAIAVLFGFAACDNSNGSPDAKGDAVRLYQAETDNVVYLVGQEANLDDFTVMVQYKDGTSERVPSSDLTLTAGDGQLAAGSTLKVKYNLAPEYQVASIDLDVTIYPVTSIKVEYIGDSYDSYYDNLVGSTYNGIEDAKANDIFNKSQYKVTAVYNTTEEKVLDADEYVVTDLADKTPSTTTADGTATIKLDLNSDGVADTGSVEGKATGIVILADKLESINATLKEDKELIAGAKAETTSVSDLFDVTGNYASGAVKAVTVSAATFVTDNFTKITAEKDAYPVEGEVTVKFTVTGLTEAQTETFAVIPNYVKSFAPTAAGVQAGASIASAITRAPTWAAGETSNGSEDATLTAVVNPTTMPQGTEVGTKIPVVVSIQGQNVAAQTIMVECVGASNS